MTTITVDQETIDFLKALIRIPSVRGNEGPAALMVCEAFMPYVDKAQLIDISDSIIHDPDYAFPLPNFTYEGNKNLECILRGEGNGKTIVFNAHLDVVPASAGQKNAFEPEIWDGKLYGRGAVDVKGQIAVLLSLVKLFHQNRVRPKGDLIFHFVIEEECGGNGTLAMIRRGVQADAAVVMEPSELSVFAAVRGAVWFTLEVFGRATHSGNVQGRVSAVEKAIDAISILKAYHQDLLRRSKGFPLFDPYPDPMPLTIGEFQAGNWPSIVPSTATLKGLIGFLPNRNRHQVKDELNRAFLECDDPWLRENYSITFPMLNNDTTSLPENHPLVVKMVNAIRQNGLSGKVDAMRASCDAWRYAEHADIPTIVFGAGSLSVAHSKEEHIKINEISLAASILFDFIQNYQSIE